MPNLPQLLPHVKREPHYLKPLRLHVVLRSINQSLFVMCFLCDLTRNPATLDAKPGVLVDAQAPQQDAQHAQESTRLPEVECKFRFLQAQEIVDLLNKRGLDRGQD